MKIKIIHFVIICFILNLSSIRVMGQDIDAIKSRLTQKRAYERGENLKGLIDEDVVYERGIYIVEQNVKVTKHATVTFKAGSQIIFKSGTYIKVEGGLKIEGSKHTMIEISSENQEQEGVGFVFSGVNNERSVNISYAKISYLLIPLNFEKNWARKSVNISNNIFKNIVTGEPSLLIRQPDNIASLSVIPFNFSENVFIENNSRIFIENIESDVLKLSFKYNLITDNHFYEYQAGIGGNSPIASQFNNNGNAHQLEILGNSFYGNYILDEKTDTILVESNFGIRGTGETFNLDGNYFGGKLANQLAATFDHFNNFQGAPYIVSNAPLLSPSAAVHGHIWKVTVDEEVLPSIYSPVTVKNKKIKMSVTGNRLFLLIRGVQFIHYTYFDAASNTVLSKAVNCEYKLDQNNNTINFEVDDDVYLNNSTGYFSVQGLRDEEGFDIPAVHLGKDEFKKYLVGKISAVK